jgi:hypothetical protein
MPDDELMGLAARGELRKNFQAQVKRMLADPKGEAFAKNFATQWLQVGSILEIPINSSVVMASESPPAGATNSAPAAVVAVADAPIGGAPAIGAAPGAGARGRGAGGFGGRGGFGRGRRAAPGTELTADVRAAMKQEVGEYFGHIVRDDRSVLELVNSDYTFLNEQLAAVYGISNVTGPEMRLVKLPPGHERGGVLTMGGVLTVTSNPTRTSPVKRGKWVLENILGAPPAPPPPNVPALEETQAKSELQAPTQRELLALHREDAMCASCHNRMDPPGLALESFNAFGRVRTYESGQLVDPSGELATGEKFTNVRDFKQALVENHRVEFYRTLTEKLLTYILGRGVEYYDVPTVDAIVQKLDQDNGRFSTLLFGILESAPFQQRRPTPHATNRESQTAALPSTTRTDL